MLSVYPSENRGFANFGWHTGHYTFSFGAHYRPCFRGYGPLRALNEHHVTPGEDFAVHSHRDMEVLSYVVSGAMAVTDSTGREVVVQAGQILRMTAGTGVECREFNASSEHPLVAIQLWIVPERPCLTPGFEKRPVTIDENPNRWCLVGSKDGRNGSVTIHQDVNLYMGQLLPGHSLEQSVASGRKSWIHIVSGSITLNNQTLVAGDAVALNSDLCMQFSAVDRAQLLLTDLPACDEPNYTRLQSVESSTSTSETAASNNEFIPLP